MGISPNQDDANSSHNVAFTSDDAEVTIQEIERVVIDNPQVLTRILNNPKIVAVIEQEYHHGPLPSPRQMKQYNDVLPDAAERIFQLTEKEQAHRHMSETTALNSAISSDKRGQWMAFILSWAVFLLGGTLILFEAYVAGVTLISTTVIGLAGIFALGRKGNKTSNEMSIEKLNEQKNE